MEKINLAIVEDDFEIRETLVEYFSANEADFATVIDFGSMEEILESKEALDGYLILLDINLPGMSGIEGIHHLKNKWNKLEILITSVLTDTQTIFDAICAGASGYLDKDTSLSKIKEGLINVSQGGSALTPSIARKVFNHFQPTTKITEKLTDREMEVVKGIVDGLSYKLIADRLVISINTIRKYIRSIYRKLEINSKGELLSRYHSSF